MVATLKTVSYGGLGEDILVGGTGNDFLTGGTLLGGPDGEQDIFVFAPGDGLDTIRDWEDTGCLQSTVST